jgi:23S rRNA pseudouridine1911/1915/1917 synthase
MSVDSILKILYEDNHCLAVFKPAGMLTVGDRTGDISLIELVKGYVKRKYRKPGNVYIGVVHRLDRPVSGVVLFARTSKAAARLSEQFRTGNVCKIYWAWVQGRPAHRRETLVNFLVKDRAQNLVMAAADDAPRAQRAELDYRVLRSDRHHSLLEIRPRTGRPHQIRVQLAAHGVPIVGDVKYGARPATAGQVALVAAELQFKHPVRNELIRVYAPSDARKAMRMGVA